jgi:large subunit ribosomal protein L17
MRHAKKRSRLGRTVGERNSLILNLCRALLINQRIITTCAKAKVVRPVAERIFSLARTDALHNRRQVFALLNDHTLVEKVFEKFAPLFKGINGGYTRIIRLNRRRGDNAFLVIFELTKQLPEEKPKVHEKKAAAKPAEPAHEKPQKKEEHPKPELERRPVTEEKVKPVEPKVKPPKQDTTKIKQEKKPGILGGMGKIFRRKQEP